MDIIGGDRFIRFLLPLEYKIVLRDPFFSEMFLEEVEGNIRQGNDAEFWVFLGSLFVI
jgi:hypothetical protein